MKVHRRNSLKLKGFKVHTKAKISPKDKKSTGELNFTKILSEGLFRQNRYRNRKELQTAFPIKHL